jgi:hypothetical protein
MRTAEQCKATEIPRDIRLAGDDVVLFYLYLITEKKQSPRMAEMLALRQSPRVMTDDTALSGIGTLDKQFRGDERYLTRLTRDAQKHGYTPKATDYYMASLARFPGDPEAFVNHGQGRGHIRKLLERRGWAGDGLVKVKGREPESDPHEERVHKLHPRIVERLRKQKLKENPDLARKDQREVRADIVSQHGSE